MLHNILDKSQQCTTARKQKHRADRCILESNVSSSYGHKTSSGIELRNAGLRGSNRKAFKRGIKEEPCRTHPHPQPDLGHRGEDRPRREAGTDRRPAVGSAEILSAGEAALSWHSQGRAGVPPLTLPILEQFLPQMSRSAAIPKETIHVMPLAPCHPQSTHYISGHNSRTL